MCLIFAPLVNMGDSDEIEDAPKLRDQVSAMSGRDEQPDRKFLRLRISSKGEANTSTQETAPEVSQQIPRIQSKLPAFAVCSRVGH